MTKTAVLFAGQGAQYLGMARDLYENHAIVRETFKEAGEILGYDLRELIDHDEEKLHQTRYTQPAILTTSIGIYRCLEEHGFRPDMAAGLSLGEYAALVAAGSLSFASALALVAKRGAFMEEAAPAGSGKMVAVLNADVEMIEKICLQASHKGVVTPANYNTPSQIVIGGEVGAVDEAVEILSQAGVKRMIPLKVSGPFHTALLKEASRRLGETLKEVEFAAFQMPVVGNTEADIIDIAQVKSLLERQVMEPVRFYESIARMKALGATSFVEIGPGKVLSGFLKKIDKSLSVYHVEDEKTLADFLGK
ncbi:ACP S-malonyltransferase [Streptococcus himalayensis]|uniref:Malonyl CoA-acyl carrier protein transacylase n=1 Tax=Streptococcus himalayensis TaxID=1888195 RepID=A0A917A6D9_9STRE|nr:ACP S-malonyltransferase [Streptococcus himalayensis]GGE25908.1 malonyl CoA-acyl carrier protein transacylase [Streptococcus himalayensis]